MKSLLTLFTTLLAVLFLAQTAAAGWSPINSSDGPACSKKNGAVTNAIGKFCTQLGTNKQIFAPSPYTTKGVWSENKKVVVKIEGNCKPAQYVPYNWCMKQLFNMCRNGDGKGQAKQVYGDNQCQIWSIGVPRGLIGQ